MSLKLIFAGTPAFAATILFALAEAGHEIALVLSRPDKPAGRGGRVQANPVKRLALERGWQQIQPKSLADAEHVALLSEVRADVMVVAAYGLILPPPVLHLPNFGCLNVHASLLPRWRGAAPIARAIEAGDVQTGITIMQMDAGLDTGDCRLIRSLPILPFDTTADLTDRLAHLGGEAVVEALACLSQAALPRWPQSDVGVTYARKLGGAEPEIDWSSPASVIVRRIHAFNPAPGVSLRRKRDGQILKVWRATTLSTGLTGRRASGSVAQFGSKRLAVWAADGAIELLEVQKPGGKRLPISQFLSGFPVEREDEFQFF